MKKWQIRYWNGGGKKGPIEKWLGKLTKEQIKSVAKDLTLLEEAGNMLVLPYSKALGKGLFELRERRFGFRMYYSFQDDCIIILLAAGNKRSQENDMKIAHKRLSLL